VGAGANALPRSWNGSPPSQFQLWRSSLPTKKILFPRLGNRLRHASNHPYFQLPTEIFGFSERSRFDNRCIQ
jgi:hypothetical protein